jgi:hypothetical protein
MNWKGFERKLFGLILSYSAGIFLDAPRKTAKTLVRITFLRAEI